MKNMITFRNNLWSTVFAVCILFTVVSCNSSMKEDDSKAAAEDQNDAKYKNSDIKNDAKFLVEAADINIKEIRLGQLAQQQGQTSDVKELGKMMEDAHAKALNELKSLAVKKDITIPDSISEKGQDMYNKLKDKKGMDFDKEYCDMMVHSHKKAIEKFEKESTDGSDADIKSWAANMLPDLHTHLDHATNCQKKCEKM